MTCLTLTKEPFTSSEENTKLGRVSFYSSRAPVRKALSPARENQVTYGWARHHRARVLSVPPAVVYPASILVFVVWAVVILDHVQYAGTNDSCEYMNEFGSNLFDFDKIINFSVFSLEQKERLVFLFCFSLRTSSSFLLCFLENRMQLGDDDWLFLGFLWVLWAPGQLFASVGACWFPDGRLVYALNYAWTKAS